MKPNKNEDYYTRLMLDNMRNVMESTRKSMDCRKNMLTEEKDGGKQKAIAITDDPRFGQNALTNQIEQFRSSVESGAQFNKPSDDNVAEAPLIFMPDTENIVFSGTIPCLNNLKWQFVLKTSTGNGCFVWSEGMILSKENLQILNKLYGFYQNWRESWIAESRDLEALKNLDL